MNYKNIVVALILMALAGCTVEKVPVGNVGVKVDLYGSDKGVQAQQVTPIQS